MPWVPIRYREFYDVPRSFLAEHQGHTYLFDCPFDEHTDEYPDHYRVSRLAGEFELPDEIASWTRLAQRGAFVAEVPVTALKFDPTRRAAVDAAVFEQFSPPIQPAR